MSYGDGHDHRGQYAEDGHDHRGQYAEDGHGHYDLADKYHRHYALEETDTGLREDLNHAHDRISDLETTVSILAGRVGELAALLEQTRAEVGP